MAASDLAAVRAARFRRIPCVSTSLFAEAARGAMTRASPATNPEARPA
jgi:hypothetical protein